MVESATRLGSYQLGRVLGKGKHSVVRAASVLERNGGSAGHDDSAAASASLLNQRLDGRRRGSIDAGSASVAAGEVSGGGNDSSDAGLCVKIMSKERLLSAAAVKQLADEIRVSGAQCCWHMWNVGLPRPCGARSFACFATRTSRASWTWFPRASTCT